MARRADLYPGLEVEESESRGRAPHCAAKGQPHGCPMLSKAWTQIRKKASAMPGCSVEEELIVVIGLEKTSHLW